MNTFRKAVRSNRVTDGSSASRSATTTATTTTVTVATVVPMERAPSEQTVWASSRAAARSSLSAISATSTVPVANGHHHHPTETSSLTDSGRPDSYQYATMRSDDTDDDACVFSSTTASVISLRNEQRRSSVHAWPGPAGPPASRPLFNDSGIIDARRNSDRSMIGSIYKDERGLLLVPGMNSRRASLDMTSLFGESPMKNSYSTSALAGSTPATTDASVLRSIKTKESCRVIMQEDGGYVQLNQYKLKDQIGRGAYGVVKLAYNLQDNKNYAMKILSKKKLARSLALRSRGPPARNDGQPCRDPLEAVRREIAILKKLHHPNVVQLIEVLDDPNKDSLYLVFELVPNGEVMTIPTDKPFNEYPTSWTYFRQLLLGLEYLHFQKIIHRDLKPSNILVDHDGNLKIADFGISNSFEGSDALLRSVAGTPAFIAPEALDQTNPYSGRAADIWSLGVTLYCFLYGQVPFVDKSILTLYQKIRSEPVPFPDTVKTSNQVKSLICSMLTKKPSGRIKMAQLKAHEWVTRNGMEPMPAQEGNCILITVTEEEVNTSVKSVARLDTLILIRTILKKRSFRNPFTTTVSSDRQRAATNKHSQNVHPMHIIDNGDLSPSY